MPMENIKVTEEQIFSDPLIVAWLKDVPQEKTRESYSYAARNFFLWLGRTPSQFLQEVKTDNQKPIGECQNYGRAKLQEFFTWVQNEMPRTDAHHKPLLDDKAQPKKGMSSGTAKVMITAIRSFMGQYNITIKFSKRHLKSSKANPYPRMNLTIDQIRMMLANARTPRDRAIIHILTQSGMDADTLCAMTYGMVQKMDTNAQVNELNSFRGKVAKEYFTFLPKESLMAINVYLSDLKARGIELNPDDPLWITERGQLPLNPRNVQEVLRIIAFKVGLIPEDAKFNVAGAHSIREFFTSTLQKQKMPDKYIDELVGHTASAMSSAYYKIDKDAIKEEYLRCLPALTLTITNGKASKEELEALRTENDAKIKVLQDKILELEQGMADFSNLVEHLKKLICKATGIDDAELAEVDIETSEEDGE